MRSAILLAIVFTIVAAISWLRRTPDTPDTSANPPPAPPAQATPDSPEPARPQRTALQAHSDAGIEPLPDIPPPNLTTLRPERESLYRELLAESNALLPEIEAALQPFQATNHATIASAWHLANNWGILDRAHAAAQERVEDPVMRDQLATARRRILVEAAESELQALLGSPIPDTLRTTLESIGRKHAASAAPRKSPPSQADLDRRAARQRASAGEDPLLEAE